MEDMMPHSRDNAERDWATTERKDSLPMIFLPGMPCGNDPPPIV